LNLRKENVAVLGMELWTSRMSCKHPNQWTYRIGLIFTQLYRYIPKNTFDWLFIVVNVPTFFRLVHSCLCAKKM